jgi:aryl sulfotransferase
MRTDTAGTSPGKTREILNAVLDSTRWNGFEFRDDDIVIGTWSKSGTTLTQQIVAQLVFGGDSEVYGQLLSPWLDFRLIPAEVVVAMANEQSHRRFLKSHLPADALVMSAKAKYIYIGRDARDVLWSWHHHHSMFNAQAYRMLNPPDRTWPEFPPADPDIRRAYHDWLDKDGYPVFPFWSHVQSWWDIRDQPNVKLVHFNQLRADLPATVLDIAAFLEIPVGEALLAKVVDHCAIEFMRRQAAKSPALEMIFEGGGANFINKGSNGRWKDVLTADEIAKADALAAANLTPDCARWLRTGERD